MKILLVFPPSAGNFGPYLSLPALTAYLKSCGIDAVQFDLNAELYDHIYSYQGIERIYAGIVDAFSGLNAESHLEVTQQEKYLDLIRGPLSGLETCIHKVEEIKTAFKMQNNYKIIPGRVSPLVPYWREYSKIKRFIVGEDDFLFNLPNCSLDTLDDLIKGRHKLRYQDVLFDLLLERIVNVNPDIVGFSFAFSSQVIPGLLAANFIKKHLPESYIVVGGPYWTIMRDSVPRLLNDLPFIDSVGIYEGEKTLVELTEKLRGGKSIFGIPNLISRDYSCVTEKRFSIIKDLDELPCPEFDSRELRLYFTPVPVLPYASARGCYYNKCAFCNFHNISSKFRARSVNRVVSDLKTLTQKFSDLFYFTQECETPDRLSCISNAILENEIDIKYQAFVRFDKRYDKKILKTIKSSGCQYLFFGLESANQRVNDFMKKGVDIENAKEIIRICYEIGQNVVVSSIQGFPSETDEEFSDTRTFYKEVRDRYENRIRIAGSSHFFRLARGSGVDRNLGRYGIEQVHRDVSGELASTFDSVRFSGDGRPLSQRLSSYYESLPEIFFNEYIVLVMTAYSPENSHLLKTTRERPATGIINTETEIPDMNGVSLKLASRVCVIPCRFNLGTLQRISVARRKKAKKMFFDMGVSIKRIIQEFGEDTARLEPDPCIALINIDTGKLLTVPERAGDLIDFFRENRTYGDFLSTLERNGVLKNRAAIDRFIQKMIANDVLLAERSTMPPVL